MHLIMLDSGSGSAGAAIGTLILLIFAGALFALLATIYWRVFAKAGKPGWAIFIPIYNFVVLFNIAGFSGWWLLIGLIPGVDIIFLIIFSMLVYWRLGEAFNRGPLFRLGLIFLAPIFMGILAFTDAKYVGVGRAYLVVSAG